MPDDTPAGAGGTPEQPADPAAAPVTGAPDPAADPFNWIFVDLPRAEVLLRRGELTAAGLLLDRAGAPKPSYRAYDRAR